MLTKSWDVRLPSGSPLHISAMAYIEFLVLKLSITCPRSHSTLVSKTVFDTIDFKIRWSIEAKNFLISHFRIHIVFVLFFETFLPNSSNRRSALCVPFHFLHEYESWINFVSKYG